MLEEHDTRDGRLVAGREEHEPAVIAQVAALAGALRRHAPRVRDHLGATGLARDIVSLDARRASGARAVDDEPQPVADRLQLVWIDLRLRLRRRRRDGFHPAPSSTALSRCGVTRVPPLASVAM